MNELNALRSMPEKSEDEDILNYVVRVSQLWTKLKSLEKRRLKAQFFTPIEVCEFMAKMFTIKKECIKLLDAGAGVGNLSAAFCSRLLASPTKYSLTIDAYEDDLELIPALESNLNVCKMALSNNGHKVEYNIHAEDFVLRNKDCLGPMSLTDFQSDSLYDFVISNPPYYKLDKNSPQAAIMRKSIAGHPNIYALFMILSAKMLKKDGELVFITPRSFCSGMYFERFREWFLQTVQINHIHIFESRRDIFGVDEVLQENILIKATRSDVNQKSVKVSSSKSKFFDAYNEIEVSKNDIIFKKNGDIFIRIPSSYRDVVTLRLVDSFPNTLKDLGLEISTGPVVVFRTAETVQSYQPITTDIIVPLLWAHNFDGMSIDWARERKNKPPYIYVNEKTKSLLVPVKNYVLLKRFSSKEQKRRLHAAVLLKEGFPFDFVGLENHLNFIYKVNGELTRDETMGIASLLNTYRIDNYFRSLNGNTQVNAVEIRSLPLPSMAQIAEIGKRVSQEKLNHLDLDKIVFEVLEMEKLASIYEKGERPLD